MEIRISLDRIDPPVGTVSPVTRASATAGSDGRIPFSGWLGLLHALSELIGSPPSSDPG